MPRFTIRVYGLLLHDDHVLVADEIIKGQRITKFPGGGLEYGEGTKDCLIREVREEIGVEAFDVRHFFTTDFFQRSTFHTEEIQVLSLYYTFRVHDPDALPVMDRPFAFTDEKEGAEAFRWLDLMTAPPDAVHLPIDKVVLQMLLGQR